MAEAISLKSVPVNTLHLAQNQIPAVLGKIIEKCASPKIEGHYLEHAPISSRAKIADLQEYVEGLVKRAEQNHLRFSKRTGGLSARATPDMPITLEMINADLDAIIYARQEAQRITYSFYDYLGSNFGLVFLPQSCVDDACKKSPFSSEYVYHIEPVGVSLNCDDTVNLYFGAPFLPLVHDERFGYVPEKQAVVASFKRLFLALEGWEKDTETLSGRYQQRNVDAVSKELREHTYRFSERLQNYSRALLPPSRTFWSEWSGGYCTNIDGRDWSLPTFNFEEPLRAKFEELLKLNRETMHPDAVKDVELTLKILDARQAIRESVEHDDFVERKKTENRLRKVSLALMGYYAYWGHPEIVQELNDSGIERIIGYRL